jgi:hypothetical protein
MKKLDFITEKTLSRLSEVDAFGEYDKTSYKQLLIDFKKQGVTINQILNPKTREREFKLSNFRKFPKITKNIIDFYNNL